jgi:hypothetical protein
LKIDENCFLTAFFKAKTRATPRFEFTFFVIHFTVSIHHRVQAGMSALYAMYRQRRTGYELKSRFDAAKRRANQS